ncbi:Ger(x)C family spore germination protein [Filobacillus milosensis]|uniref:Ger(X)C family spore germination protein n=1 Tax=Filobacillus milosensis TaxID=94137 RepID=A0A4Y8ILI6_9BACI|nr:Ger(x)C family spore germination protein [Filobacillus milosensis]TFB22151.1 Ger(x)C family spore germination protein [Filobacillus milosensis]
MQKIKQLMLVSISCLFFLTGCLESNILEELGIVTIYGFDKAEKENTLRATTVLFQFNPDITDASQIITSEGHTFRELRNNANKKSGYKIVSGQLRTVLFGPELSKEGIFPYLDTLERDASISDMVFVAMSTQPTEEVLTASNYEQSPNIGTYIQRLIDTAVRDERLISNTLHEFTRKFFEVGHDPLVPIINNYQDKAQISGLAVFQNDKHVGEISLEETFYVRLISDKFNSGQVEMKLPLKVLQNYLEEYEKVTTDVVYVVLDQINNRADVELSNPEGLQFRVKLDIEGRIVELSERIDLSNKKALEAIEKEINNEVVENLQALIQKSKELNADFFGFGKTYVATKHGKKITEEQWRDMYKDIQVEIDVKSRIRSYGIVE